MMFPLLYINFLVWLSRVKFHQFVTEPENIQFAGVCVCVCVCVCTWALFSPQMLQAGVVKGLKAENKINGAF